MARSIRTTIRNAADRDDATSIELAARDERRAAARRRANRQAARAAKGDVR